MIIAGLYNYKHKLNNTNILYKALFVTVVLISVLVKNNSLYNCCIFPVMFILICYTTSIKILSVFKLFAVPILFLIFSCITIAIDINSEEEQSLISINSEGIKLATDVFLRSITIVSIVFFWMLTNTISEISNLLRYIRVHPIFVDLFVLTYRFIIILFSVTTTMFTAQKCKIAYSAKGSKYKALSFLFSRVFNRSLQVADLTYRSMDSRLYDSRIVYLSRTPDKYRTVSPILYIPLIIFSTLYFIL
jgi:cobalt/nickel transport system permease protein